MTWRIDGEPVDSGGRDDRLLLWNSVRQIAGISRTTAWRMQQTGDFPSPVPISPNRVGWWESELTAWKASRKAGGRMRPRAFDPPREPRLIAAGRSRRPEAGEASLAKRDPVPPPEPPAVRRRARRPAASPAQIDFGF